MTTSADAIRIPSSVPPRPVVEPQLGLPGLTYRDLFDAKKLPVLAARFDAFAREHTGAEVWERFERYRATRGEGMAPEEISETIVAIAPHLGAFLARLFDIEGERDRLLDLAARESVIFRFKREFVKKRVAKRSKTEINA